MNELAARALGEQGFLFQQRCLQEIKEQGVGWRLVSEEHPTSIAGVEVVIDFILHHEEFPHLIFVFECKRAHPDFVSWVFADTLIYRRTERTHATVLSRFTIDKPEHGVSVSRIDIHPPSGRGKECYVSSGLEVSLKPLQSNKVSKSEIIWSACRQVITGMAGFMSEQIHAPIGQGLLEAGAYIPIVVTTARLYVTAYDGSSVSLEKGVIAASDLTTNEAGWVFYDFPLPARVYESWLEEQGGNENSLSRKFQKTRQVIIVNSASLIEFLNSVKYYLSP
jgi:hypothetical protein